MSWFRCIGFLLAVALLGSAGQACAQTPDPAPPRLPALPAFSLPPDSSLHIVRDTNPTKPVSVVGPRGALLGEQDGAFEGWIFPWKIFSNLRISAHMQDYAVPIDVNEYAASIDVQPDHTTITYSHANFTIRETLLAPSQPANGSGIAAYFEVEAVRPMDLTFSFTPEMKIIWPAPSDDIPSPEWVKTDGGSGFYMLHLNFPDHASAIAMPGAEPGILAPYQERPKTYPLQFIEHFDPAKDTHTVYPLLVSLAEQRSAATKSRLGAALLEQENHFAATYLANRGAYQHFLDTHTTIETPDHKLDESFRWAELAIEQLRVQTVPSHSETALVAGFYTSGDSARPGFGWFFGRDALFSLYAVNSFGDLELSRDEINFLLKRQRADGKIGHEWAQSAELVDWNSLPYQWASSDATPLLLMEMADYLKVSGDVGFLNAHWEQMAKAWNFETTHDSDGDGIYENTEGSGWVESWPPGMPHQEIYLAAVDQQASTAFAQIAAVTGHPELSAAATARAGHIKAQIEKEYYLPQTQSYAFSRNADGSTDPSATIFPAMAWWDGSFSLERAGPMLSRWASSEFSTDWGTRDLSPSTPFYDPISYHQGTVWPLYTGWVSLAEYRAGRPLSGYAHLKQNSNLTWSQDLGAVTELLSGEFFHPLGRSTSHQLWSSAMVVVPLLRGLFGIEWDAAHDALDLAPELPATWEHAIVRDLTVGQTKTDLTFTRKDRMLEVTASNGVHLLSRQPGSKVVGATLELPLPAIEIFLDSELPTPGATTGQTKVLDQQQSEHAATFRLAGLAGSTQAITVRLNDPRLQLRLNGQALAGAERLRSYRVTFPKGANYTESVLAFTW